ncbi:hypothetical protein D3C79_1028120 [compost metagenome]
MVAILTPYPVKKGQQAMMEKIQKQPETRFLPRVLPGQFVKVIAGHRRLAAMQTQKGHFNMAQPTVVLA